ncbi:uncharacterized protein N7506_001859 [Penicillium brevicompactum]|uniref:uncharacterized protein n=1 Tax=Penicillium brevicompactum TaxID=5074 RepID=UPI002540DA3E|nr:uncharacterized protein N7506_001859 [Penicillium brevicompactum]KAJ5348606.1 hypothetical protein N7506_001859 [Penicillium brevicompactum]
MGVSESRVVIETLSAACAEAEENEKDNIEDLLTSKVVLSVRCDAFGLKSHIRAIPLSGPDREEEIRRLKIRGILDVEGKNNIDDLADAMFGKLWEKIEDSISRGTQFTGTGQDWALQQTRSFRIQHAGNSARQDVERQIYPTTCPETREVEYPLGHSRPHSAAPVPSTSTSNLHIAVSNSAAHLPTHGDGNEIARDSPGFSAEEISAPMVQSGSIGMVGEHTLAWMGSTLNMHENAYPIPQEPMDAIDERAIAWTGSTLNMHENAYPIPQEPMDAIDERAIAWTGSTLNMHENAYPIPQEPMDAIDERAIAWMGSTLSMHENADPIPRESMEMLQDRDIFGPDGAVEPFAVEYRDPESQTSIETPNISSQYHWSVSRQQIQWPVVVK